MASDVPNDPVSTAAVSWIDDQGQAHIRVYSCDGYSVIERCNDGGSAWTTGQFEAQGSAVSATCWTQNGAVYLRVYCTFEDVTTEWYADPNSGWAQGSYTTS